MERTVASQRRDSAIGGIGRDRTRLASEHRCQQAGMAEHRLALGWGPTAQAAASPAAYPGPANRSGPSNPRSALRAFACTLAAEKPRPFACRSHDRPSSPRPMSRFAARVISAARSASFGCPPCAETPRLHHCLDLRPAGRKGVDHLARKPQRSRTARPRACGFSRLPGGSAMTRVSPSACVRLLDFVPAPIQSRRQLRPVDGPDRLLVEVAAACVVSLHSVAMRPRSCCAVTGWRKTFALMRHSRRRSRHSRTLHAFGTSGGHGGTDDEDCSASRSVGCSTTSAVP